MNKLLNKSELTGELSLVIWIFLAASIGVVIRYLNEYFLIFQQVFFRSSIALVLSFIIYYIFFGKNDFSKITRYDWGITFLRAIFHLGAITFWILALLNTTLANATLVGSVPATAILGILFFGDRLFLRSFIYISLSILGAIIISYEGNFTMGIGEMYAFIASFLFSTYSLLRKKLSDHIGDREVSLISLFSTSVLSLCVFLIYQPNMERFIDNYEPISIIYLIIGALIFLGISFFGIYGFKRVAPIKASSIEFLEIPFAIMLGYIFFGESLSIKEAIGGVLIVCGAYLMMIEKKK